MYHKIIAFPSNFYSLTSTNDFYRRKRIGQCPTKHRLNFFQSINLFKISIRKTFQIVTISHVVHLKDIPHQRGKGKTQLSLCRISIILNNVKTQNSKKEIDKDRRNMELICISSLDDNKDVSDEHTRYNNSTSHHPDDHKSVSIVYRTMKMQYAFREKFLLLPNECKIKKEKKINILQQNSLVQLFISKETEAEFLKYRIEYYNLLKCSPMYSDNTRNKPWNIVAW